MLADVAREPPVPSVVAHRVHQRLQRRWQSDRQSARSRGRPIEAVEVFAGRSISPPGAEIDDRALQPLVDRHVNGGSAGVVACGTTGEASTLSQADRRRVVELAIEAVSGRIRLPLLYASQAARERIEAAMLHAGLLTG